MRAASEVKAVLCNSAAVLALVWFGQAATAQDVPTDEPEVVAIEDGPDGFIGPAVIGETVVDEAGVDDAGVDEAVVDEAGVDDGTSVDFDGSACGGCEVWTTFVQDGEGDEAVDGEEVVFDDGAVVDDGEVKTEDDTVVVDAGGEEEGEFVTTCDGCEVQNMAGGEIPVFMAGSPEVQRDIAGEAPVVLNGDHGSDSVVSRNSGNACDAGALSKTWICTVQGDSWRD